MGIISRIFKQKVVVLDPFEVMVSVRNEGLKKKYERLKNHLGLQRLHRKDSFRTVNLIAKHHKDDASFNSLGVGVEKWMKI